MHQQFQRAYSWRGPARQRSQQMCAAGCCSTTSRHTSASWVRPALSSCNSIPAACRSQQCGHGCCVPGAGRLTKAAVPVPLLHGRSLGPICILTTLTHTQTPAAPVSLCTRLASFLLDTFQDVASAHARSPLRKDVHAVHSVSHHPLQEAAAAESLVLLGGPHALYVGSCALEGRLAILQTIARPPDALPGCMPYAAWHLKAPKQGM